jgi:tRNA threonylcarbamoyladenosine biosynthesis protein TsaB
MRILAIETVETTGSVALLEDDVVVAQRQLDARVRSAQSLAPGIAGLLEECGLRAADVDLVAVANGPGSFTGLRIGVTTAKVFAYAASCQVIGVGTMMAIASRVPADVPHFSVVLDAQRGELFVADFSRQAGGKLFGCETTRVVDAQRWIDELSQGTVVTGPGLSHWSGRLGPRAILVDRGLWAATAAAVGRVGWRSFAEGVRTAALVLVPQYFRRTAAEEQWEQQSKDEGRRMKRESR